MPVSKRSRVPGHADRDREQRRVAVAEKTGFCGPRAIAGGRGEGRWSLTTRRAVGGGQPALALVDDDRGRQLAARVALDGLERLDRLGLAGEERDRLVLLRVLELAGEQPADDRRDEEEDAGDDELRAPPAGKVSRDVPTYRGTGASALSSAALRARPARSPAAGTMKRSQT
jgi:hypothetical protein